MRSPSTPSKTSTDVIVIRMNFQAQAEFGEIIGSGAVVASVFTGEDPAPSGILSSPATVSGYDIVQEVSGGVAGVIYQLTFFAHGSGDHIYSRSTKLAIVNSPADFNGPS